MAKNKNKLLDTGELTTLVLRNFMQYIVGKYHLTNPYYPDHWLARHLIDSALMVILMKLSFQDAWDKTREYAPSGSGKYVWKAFHWFFRGRNIFATMIYIDLFFWGVYLVTIVLNWLKDFIFLVHLMIENAQTIIPLLNNYPGSPVRLILLLAEFLKTLQ